MIEYFSYLVEKDLSLHKCRYLTKPLDTHLSPFSFKLGVISIYSPAEAY
ncbi:hypothetical protein MtrunA17_Chr1g0180671 [Medicago truncatula]|uniref:Uncharacterized protein n=1 Tax=Medicago truncatula TaxID=3880 RepID=A0A396JN76_MEDTR|nr:hypothetical protein MtrunA17_Chr1g0180671 [Medicago truncatula]